MKISFLLPTNRKYEDYGALVVKNINENCSHEKEILIFGPDEIKDENVKWFKEEEASGGVVLGLNLLFRQSKGE